MMAGERLTKLGALASDLEQAAEDRFEDAKALLLAGRHAAAIAHGFYALEIRLKVLICRRLDVPKLPHVFQTHSLEALMLHTGLANKIRGVKRPRAVAKNWDELLALFQQVDQIRYQPDPKWDERLAKRVLHQLGDPPNGVLLWLKKQASLKRR